ncbi:MAG: hypothetical protein WC634_03615 [archaeon]
MAVRKARKKPVSKRPAAKKAGSRVVRKDIRSLKKGLRKEIALTRKVSTNARTLSTRSKGHDKELDLLRREIELLKKRKKRAGLSEYQRFMRVQIRAGRTFRQAAALWMRRKKESAKKNRKRSSYNVFVSMQLKQGKTMKQAIRAWNILKNPPKKKRRPKKKKPVKKRVAHRMPVKRKRPVKRKKPVKRKRPVKRRVVRRKRRVVTRRPVVVSKEVFPEEKVARIVESVMERVQSGKIERVEETVSTKSVSSALPCDEELALKMIDVYFGEVARYGLKRKLALDEVVNAYFYCLMRVQRKGVEMNAVKEMIGRRKG